MKTVRTYRLGVLLALVAFLLAACARQPIDPSPQPLEPAKNVETQGASTPGTVAVPAGVYPPETRTGIASVDRIVEAVESGDPDKLFAYVQFTNVPCSTDVQNFAPWCKEGQPEGSERSVFMLGPCRAIWQTDVEQVKEKFRALLAPPRYLFAVYKMSRELSPSVKTMYEVVVVQNAEDKSAIQLGIGDNGNIRTLTVCGAAGDLPQNLDYVLSPKR